LELQDLQLASRLGGAIMQMAITTGARRRTDRRYTLPSHRLCWKYQDWPI
jgi:hypothetical protein